MFTGAEMVREFQAVGITHVVWLPDSTLGPWEQELESAEKLHLVRVCREGEAWAVAAGLHLGGAVPLVVIQCTGLFESGDALRNFVHDLGLPLFALIGYRSFLTPARNTDTAAVYTEPILRAWNLDCRLIERPDQLPLFTEHYRRCQAARKAGVVLLAEGRM